MAGNYRSKLAHYTAKWKTKEIDWASPVQKSFFEYGPFPACASGGYGSGKTFGACFKALLLSDIFPNNRGIIARRVHEELKKTTMSTFFKLCPKEAYMFGGRRSDNEKILKLNNGSEILWMHLDNPETENVIQGVEINWFVIDQAEEVEEEIYEKLMSRLGRWDQAEVPDWLLAQYKEWPWRDVKGNPTVPIYPMITCNPSHLLHWIYRRFHQDSDEYDKKFIPDPSAPDSGVLRSYKDLGYKMFHMNSLENKYLLKQTREQMLARDDSFKKRFVYGVWGIPEGTIHTVDDLSIVPGTPDIVEWIRQRCTLYRAYDHGDTSPAACLWFGVDIDGSIYVYREYYKANTLISDHRRNVFELSKYGGPGSDSAQETYALSVADPSIFVKTMQKYGGRYSAADEYEDCVNQSKETALFWEPGDNDEMGTRNRISELLAVDPSRIHPFTKEFGAPRLFFIKKTAEHPHGCDNLLREIKSQRYIKAGTVLGKPVFTDERDEEIPDHAYDALRYFVAFRAAPHYVPTVRKSAGTFEGARQLVRMQQRASLKGLTNKERREMRRWKR